MIEIGGVSVSIDNTPILSGIDAVFSPGEVTCIVGSNGSGKSTLLRAAAGIIPYEGSIRLFGEEVRNLKRTDRAKKLAYLPQHRPVPVTDVYTLISHGRYAHMGFAKVLTAGDREKIEAAVCMTGVQDLMDRDVPSLSGGERQRVYLAMAVAQDAEMILLDEPATFLDIEHQLQVMELLMELNRAGKGIVAVVHDLEQAFHFAGRIYLMDKGKIAVSGSPGGLCGNEALKITMGVTVERSANPQGLYDYQLVRGGGR